MLNRRLLVLTKLAIAIAIAIVIIIPVSSAKTAWAYEVTIKNDTPYYYFGSLWIAKFMYTDRFEWISLQPGQSNTWKTGGWCPTFFDGSINGSTAIFGPSGWRNLQSADCYGNKGGTWSGVCCWNLKFKICKKVTGDYHEIRDNDYGFCKE